MTDETATTRTPKYVQLAQHLYDTLISVGQPHELLPTERDLQQAHGVSRDTVRRAIALLSQKQLVYNVQGSGTYIAAQNSTVKSPSLVSFTEDIEARGMTPATTTLSCHMVPAPAAAQRDLGLEADSKVIKIVRLRWANGAPIALETAHFIPEAFSRVEPEFSTSLDSQLASSGYRIERATQRISATNLTAAEAEQLALPQGAAALVVERVGFTRAGQAIETTRALYRADRYDFELDLTRP